MKKQLFSSAAAIMLAFTSAPLAVSAENDMQHRGLTPDGTYNYEIWNADQCGQVFFDGAETAGGTFTCKWTDVEDCMFSKGHSFDTPKNESYRQLGSISCDYALDYSANGDSGFGVHGWIEESTPPDEISRMAEFYIIDGYSKLALPQSAVSLGQFTSNGCTYDLYSARITSYEWTRPEKLYYIYYSVITEEDNPVKFGEPTSVSHLIDVDQHFKAWEDAGIYMAGRFCDVSFYVSGFECSGEAAVTKNDIVIDNIPKPVFCGDVNGDEEFNTEDYELLKQWLLSDPDAELSCKEAADLSDDEQIDAIDLSLMMRALYGTDELQDPTDLPE